MKSATAFVAELLRRGVEVSALGDQLRIRAPKGILTPGDREALLERRDEILESLRSPGGEARPGSTKGATAGNPAKPDRADPGTKSRKSRKSPSRTIGSGSANSAISTTGSGHIDAASGPIARTGSSVVISGRPFSYFLWDGEILGGDCLGFDTETALIQGHVVPELALAAASDGEVHCLIHPDRIGKFLRLHRGRQFIFHNVAFDYWVVHEHLVRRRERKELEAWSTLADQGGMHDTMILDQLIRLGQTDAYPRPRDLGVVAMEHAGMEVDKSDPFRYRYGEIIGVDWSVVDPGFLGYGMKDPIVTLMAYRAMESKAKELMDANIILRPDALERFGLLSESIQVKGAISLANITHLGMDLDPDGLEKVRINLRRRLDEQVTSLMDMPRCGALFKRDRRGQLILTEKTQAPSLSQSVLRDLLADAAGMVGEAGRPVSIPKSEKGKVSLAAEDWEELAPFDPLIASWIELGRTTKALQHFGGLVDATVHPHYTTLVRTGRTSCSGPNIQNLPRKGGFREAFIPRPGFHFLIVDYAFIELRTLAAECEARYVDSRLADVIREGIDPHSFTAAMFEGVDLAEFMRWKESTKKNERLRFDLLRQQAKVLNFGIPGGLGPRSLVAYARSTYGVTLTLEEATEFRDRLINEVYPELGMYLADDGMDALAWNLGASVQDCWARLDWKGDRSGAVVGGTRRIVRGETMKADGQPYSTRYSDGVWDSLTKLNRVEELAAILAKREGSKLLQWRLFHAGITTLTGRVRGRVSFTQARNTPFQGLAADGAKLAIWSLIRAGYRVVAFIHDEFVIELPENADHAAEAIKVEAIVNLAMEQVTGNVPVACEYALALRWSKKAKAIFDPEGRLVPWDEAASG